MKKMMCVIGPRGMRYCSQCGVMIPLASLVRRARVFTKATRQKMAAAQKQRWSKVKK